VIVLTYSSRSCGSNPIAASSIAYLSSFTLSRNSRSSNLTAHHRPWPARSRSCNKPNYHAPLWCSVQFRDLEMPPPLILLREKREARSDRVRVDASMETKSGIGWPAGPIGLESIRMELKIPALRSMSDSLQRALLMEVAQKRGASYFLRRVAAINPCSFPDSAAANYSGHGLNRRSLPRKWSRRVNRTARRRTMIIESIRPTWRITRTDLSLFWILPRSHPFAFFPPRAFLG